MNSNTTNNNRTNNNNTNENNTNIIVLTIILMIVIRFVDNFCGVGSKSGLGEHSVCDRLHFASGS